MAWFRRGLGEKPQLLEAAQDRGVEDNDEVGNFIKTHCECGVGKEFVIGTTNLREEYQRANECQIDLKKFKTMIKARGVTAKTSRVKGVMQAFHGIRLKIECLLGCYMYRSAFN